MVNVNNGSQRLGILVGGGPAPGINSVISAVTIEAQNSNLEVIGIYAGFAGLIEGNTTRSEERRVGKGCRSRWSPDH